MGTGIIELPRRTGWSGALFAIGLIFVIAGVALFDDSSTPLVAGIFMTGLGVAIVLVTSRQLFARSPRFRATVDGVWFGGGSIIPWTEIKCVFEANVSVQMSGALQTTSSIAFEFHRRATLLRAPIGCWFASPFGVGDIDVSPTDSSDRASVLASRLEAMRVQVAGSDDGAPRDTTELPAARVVDHDDSARG